MSVRCAKSILLVSFSLIYLAMSGPAHAYTANKVWFETRKNGRFRVFVAYTVPALKEFREAYVDFTTQSEAEAFYWDLIRGADFYPPNAASREFTTQPSRAEPW